MFPCFRRRASISLFLTCPRCECVGALSLAVMGALSDTEEVNILLQEEIKQLLKEQDEQDELRNELHAELTERGELMQRMVRQTISDSTDSTNILDRIQMLRAGSCVQNFFAIWRCLSFTRSFSIP